MTTTSRIRDGNDSAGSPRARCSLTEVSENDRSSLPRAVARGSRQRGLRAIKRKVLRTVFTETNVLREKIVVSHTSMNLPRTGPQ